MTVINSFIPPVTFVDSITNANPAVVTTTTDHGYLSGLFVRLFFPEDVGLNILNEKIFEITVLSDNSFSVPFNTTNLDVYSPVSADQFSQVIPVGEDADSLSQAKQNSGNISPEIYSPS